MMKCTLHQLIKMPKLKLQPHYANIFLELGELGIDYLLHFPDVNHASDAVDFLGTLRKYIRKEKSIDRQMPIPWLKRQIYQL